MLRLFFFGYRIRIYPGKLIPHSMLNQFADGKRNSHKNLTFRAPESIFTVFQTVTEGFRMFIPANFIHALATILNFALNLYMWVIVVRALISWVSPDPYNPIVQFLYRVTEPVLYPIRKRLPFGQLGIDFSPIIVIMVIIFLQYFLVATLQDIAFRMKS
jgi:YggT family protein